MFASWLKSSNDITAQFLAAGKLPDMVNLGGGLPDAGLYPETEIKSYAAQILYGSSSEWLEYAPVAGIASLREAIAQLETENGLPSAPENILVTSGGLQGLSIVGQAFLDFGAPAAVQSPAYLGLIDAWRPRQPEWASFNVHDTPALKAAFTASNLAYLMPAFANPDGSCLADQELEHIVQVAAEHGTLMVEDDPYRELYFDTPTPLSLSARAKAAGLPYLHIGSLSKTLAPGLRAGWINAPAEIIERLTLVKQGSDMTSPGLPQLLAEAAIRNRLMDTQLPKLRAAYKARCSALLNALDTHLGDWFEWRAPTGGMFVWVTSKREDIDTTKLFETGLKHGVCISPGVVFDPIGADTKTARLNFTFNTEAKIEEGVRRLAKAVQDTLR